MKKTIAVLLGLAGVASAAYEWNGGDTITSENWGDKDNWVLTDGSTWTGAGNGPGTANSNMWRSIIVSGASGLVGDKPGTAVSPIMEGWNLGLTLTNGSNLTFGQIKKFQGGVDIDIDATSSLTIKEYWSGNDGGSVTLNNAGSFTLYYSLRHQGGDGFNMNLFDSGEVTFLSQNGNATQNSAKVTSITAQLTGSDAGIQTRQLITMTDVSFADTVTTYNFTDADGKLMTAVDSLAALETASAPSYFVTKDASGISVAYTYGISVPEPTTTALSLLALAGVAARRRRK